MADIGKLCYVYGGSALAYKSGESALIYKSAGEEYGDIVVKIEWSPQSYVCKKYGYYHEIKFVCSGTWSAGSGTSTTDASGSLFVITLADVAPSSVYAISLGCTTPCEDTTEDPGVTCNVYANQRGAVPSAKQGVSCPRNTIATAAVVRVEMDADGKLLRVY